MTERIRLALWRVALGLVVASPLLAGWSRVGWEFAQVAGLIGLLAMLFLCGTPVRPRAATPSRVLELDRHTLIGWVAVAALSIHVAGVLLADPIALEYLKPGAPWQMMAGIAASVLLVALCTSATLAWRRRLFPRHRAFQSIHVIAGCAALVLALAHVIATSRYAGGLPRHIAYVLAALGALLALLRPRANAPAASGGTRLVFGRHSMWVACALVTLAAAAALLAFAPSGAALRTPIAAREAPLPLDFPHGRHTQVNCLTCHHNFADGRGFENCVSCHRSARTDLKEAAEPRFHDFCLGCHRHPTNTLGHGPVAACSDCHHAALGTPP